MFGLFRKKIREATPLQNMSGDYQFKWYDVGEGNPFDKRILDIRGLTQHMLSTTKDKSIAELFLKQRQSIGKELIDIKTFGNRYINTRLVYPHDGKQIEGAGYKAKCMEDKWDMYCWNDIIYLTRSWTGEIGYKAFINVTGKDFSIYKIEFSLDSIINYDSSMAINDVHFLIMTLAFGRVCPHKVPQTITSEKDIALYSFSKFGHNCWYATHEDITDIKITLSS